MSPAGHLRSYKSTLRVENRCIDRLQRISPDIIIPVTAGKMKTIRIHTIVLHGLDDFELVVLCRFVNRIKTLL